VSNNLFMTLHSRPCVDWSSPIARCSRFRNDV